MNKDQRENCEILRSMSSSQALEWLASSDRQDRSTYINCRSWEKKDHQRLAELFLSNIPHASGRTYDQLLSIMSISSFVKVIREHVPDSESKRDLLAYYLVPALQKHTKNERDDNIVKVFLDDL